MVKSRPNAARLAIIKPAKPYAMRVGANWRWGDSNPRPLTCEASALPAELHPRTALLAVRKPRAAEGLYAPFSAPVKNNLSAQEYLPDRISIKSLRDAAQHCRGCDLYRNATQTVFGQGRKRSRFMLVGEVPGDREDVQGKPFVGPAGALLRRALGEANIAVGDAYVTNAVKHFKFVVRGKRRIHQKPNAIEIRACRPWLEAEFKAVKPSIIVALGATAAGSIMGSGFRLMQQRGRVLESPYAPVVATIHPSAILRARDRDERHDAYASFVSDLKVASRAA